jgi:hypothetical protein
MTNQRYDLKSKNDLARLEKRARFTYIDLYRGREGKKLKSLYAKKAFQDLLNKYPMPALHVCPIAILGGKGLGVVAAQDLEIPKGRQSKGLGIYWGELLLEAPETSSYIFTLSKQEIDARKFGSWPRFVNHSAADYNVVSFQRSHKIGKVRLSYIEYAIIKPVKRGEQLLIDYGPTYVFDSGHRLFLNPSNGALSFSDIYKLNEKHYSVLTGKALRVCKRLAPQVKKWYAPTALTMLLDDAKARPRFKLDPVMPIIQAGSSGRVIDDAKQQGLSILMLAAYMGKVKTVETLLKRYRANVNQQNIRTGHNALVYTIEGDAGLSAKMKLIKLLIKSGANVSVQDHHGQTALHWCVKMRNLPLLKYICSISKSKDEVMDLINVVDDDDLCPITYAISLGEKSIAAYLLDIYQRHFRENFFNPRHNDWLLSIFKKVVTKRTATAMRMMLLKKGLSKNTKLFRALTY